MSSSRWQALQQRSPPWRRALYIALFMTTIFFYAYVFFHFSPDRRRDVVVRINADMQAQFEKESVNTLPPNTNVPKARTKSLSSRLVDVVLIIYSLNVLTRFFIRVWLPRSSRSRLERRAQRITREQREERFMAWADSLNAQRQSNGHPPISIDSLRLVIREHDMTGEDYDSLLQFNEEAGPAMGILLNQIGASQDEIERLPLRLLTSGDDIFKNTEDDQQRSRCAICLENYNVGETVRTIPCLHYFHQNCIDPWLSERAVCPICKHSAVA